MSRAVNETTEKRVTEGLVALLEGASIRESLVVFLSMASASAMLMGMSKLDLQKELMRLYDKRFAEQRASDSKEKRG